MSRLIITIEPNNRFFSLYSEGPHEEKVYLKSTGQTLLYYPDNAVVFLYYTYPTHREAAIVRNTATGGAALPGLSKKVPILLSVHASRVDKLRRAASFLRANAGGPFHWTDAFYTRLDFILRAKGKLNYLALENLITSHKEFL